MNHRNDMNVGDPQWTAGDEEHEQPQPVWHAGAGAASSVAAEPVSWVVRNIVPDEGVTVIGGEPGAGKTFLGCKLAADVVGVSQCPVVFATSGQEPLEQLRWRLDQAGADTRRVALVSLTPKRFTNPRRGLSDEAIDQRIDLLRRALLSAGDPTSGLLPAESANEPRPVPLLVIDDVDGWFGRPGQCLSAATLARVIQHLNQLAQSLHVAIVVLTRAPMSAEGRLTSAQLARLSQSASVVWLLVKDREEGSPVADFVRSRAVAAGHGQNSHEFCNGAEGRGEAVTAGDGQSCHEFCCRRWLLPVKNNLAPDGATFGRALELSDGRFRWRAGVAPSLAEATQPSLHNSDRRRLRRAAAVWLEEALDAGPLASKELYRQGVENGFSQGTLKRAATELGIFPHKTGFGGGWEMRWTGCASSTERAEIEAASCASSAERGEIEAASCASSTECEEIDATSCASSTESKAESRSGLPHPSAPSPLPEGERAEASCASSQKSETIGASRDTKGKASKADITNDTSRRGRRRRRRLAKRTASLQGA